MGTAYTELYDPKEGAKDKRDVCEAITRRLFLRYDIEQQSDLNQSTIQQAIEREAKDHGITPARLKQHIVFCMGATREGGTSRYSYTSRKLHALLAKQVLVHIDEDNARYFPDSDSVNDALRGLVTILRKVKRA